MYITIYIVAIVLALVVIVYGANVILRARKWLTFWDVFTEDEELVDFVSLRGLENTVFKKTRKKRPYNSVYFGMACIVFGICVILVALGTLFF